MKTSTLIGIVSVSCVGAALYFGQPVIAAIATVGAAVLWNLHVLEVKINRLLDELGITVTQEEMLR